MRIEFLRDPVFWITFAILNCFWFWGFLVAFKSGWATPRQMMRDHKHGICWTGHFGFWHLLLVLQPVLSWTTANMWHVWRNCIGLLTGCTIVGLVIGYVLQTIWSRQAGSNDAWSRDGMPNAVGIIHILHMGPEVGIMLMIVWGAWFGEINSRMFGGLLVITLNHFLLGTTHWPLKWWMPIWRPEGIGERLDRVTIIFYIASTITLLSFGFVMLSRS
jgi:hypothetical protein